MDYYWAIASGVVAGVGQRPVDTQDWVCVCVCSSGAVEVV